MMILVIGADSELDDKYPEIHLRERHCGIVIVAGAVVWSFGFSSSEKLTGEILLQIRCRWRHH
jgi:hypothetical protein